MPTDPTPDQGVTADQITPATTAAGWKKPTSDFEGIKVEEEGFFVDLPSSNRVRMFRTLDMPLLLKTGRIPNPLAGIVQVMIDERQQVFPREAMDMQIIEQFLDLQNETCVRCILSPEFDMPEKRGYKDGKKLPPKLDADGKTIPAESAEEYQQRINDWVPSFTDAGLAKHLREGHAPLDQSCDCERKVSVWDLTVEDRNFIFAVAQGAAADLASFRSEQGSALSGVSAGRPVRKPTKRTGGSGSRKKK